MKKIAKPLITVLLVAAMLVPTVAMLYSSAADATYPVELGFNNLFIFEEWASNENSTTVVNANGVKGGGELTKDVANGSFTLNKKDAATPQIYNGHGESRTDSVKNTDYYSISVEPNTTYCFSYNLDRNSGNSVSPYLFLFDSSFLCKVVYEAPGANNGANSFMFITPPDVTYIQFRFTLNADGKTAVAEFSNISLTKCNVELNSSNLFDFNSWANSQSGKTAGVSGMVFADGEVTPNTGDKSIAMKVNAGGSLFTGFSLDTANGYYTIPVSANTSYVVNYNLIESLAANFEKVTPYIVTVSKTGSIAYVGGCGASGYGKSSCIFTTAADTASISLVFAADNAKTTEWQVAVKDIELLKAENVADNKISPHRLVKTYGTDATYGSLPTLTAPANYIFAGWNTKEDGTGMRIAADTPVQPMSLTVYPKFEPAVDSLTVVTEPNKKVYTVGEKLDTTGLVLNAIITGKTDADGDGATDPDTTFNITSGYYCTPDTLTAAGTQTITVHYGGKTATFNVTVKTSDPGVVIVNGTSTNVTIANSEYTFNLSTPAFNRYEVTYKSDSYVSCFATFNDGKTEEFFLEPSDNGSFASYIDRFLENNTYNQILKIKFTTLDKDNGNFELISLNTVSVADPGDTIYFKNSRYEMGVSLKYGGSVSELYDLENAVYARTYANGSKDITQIDYLNKLNENYGTNYKQQSDKVNLINTLDRGRYLQQSYYGTGDKPYIQSEYNNADWPYNPVQGGNVIGEASKIIDYKVTDEYVYVKARPLDWAKWSDEYAATDSRYEAVWGDDYITDTYVEAWYYFQGDAIKVTNRKVDYSGLPEASHSQEFPALYLVEPLNHFVYNNVSAQDAWKTSSDQLYSNGNYQFIDYTDATRGTHWSKTHNAGKLINYEEPEYWGLTQMYKDKFGMQDFEPWVTVNENWAAFTASEDQDSFGVGLYTDTTTKFYYGVQPTMYQQKAGSSEGSVGEVLDTPEYRHAETINPSPELPTSYIAPTDTMIFRSYEPTEFSYYLTTGTAKDIREGFREIAENKAEAEAAKPKIAVPETVYLKPDADGRYTDGQYYVNNVMDKNNYYNIEPTVEKDYMYMGFHVEGAEHFKVNLTNVDEPANDVIVSDRVKGDSYENMQFDFDDTDTVEFYDNLPLGLHFSGEGLEPGEKATVRWDITVIYENGTEEVYTAYTVMYAPHRTVGAVAEARQVNASQNEISSWITGANGVDHSQRAPLGSYHGDYHDSGYFRQDPLVYPDNPPTGGTGESEDDYIVVDEINGPGTSIDYTDNSYVLQTATNGHDSSRAQSYLGLLTVDGSRYTNTSQIPNLKIGWDALRCGSAYPNNSMEAYTTYYTLGTVQSYTATSLSAAPSGWTTHSDYDQLVKVLGGEGKLPYRETLVPEYKVSEIDGKYIHALNQAMCIQTAIASRYSTAGTSVLCSVTDKSALRDSVMDGYGVKNPTDDFLEKLENAATILGDPSASQEEIDQAKKDLDDSLNEILNVLYSLKYDNFFSAYEFSQHSGNMTMSQPNESTISYKDGTLTTTNTTLGHTTKKNDDGTTTQVPIGETYSNYGTSADYYRIELKPNTEYVFEYDVTTTATAQAFLFFYNSSGGNSEKATNITIQTDRSGTWVSKTESNSWIGNYLDSAGTKHYAIKFTTGATTTQVGFRFGNTSHDPVTSTFSNIKLIDADRYYADVEYSSVEDLYKEYASYGALPVLTRPGYTFNGWKDEKGNVVTSANIATKHESIFSQWTIINYTITYDANSGSVSPTSETYNVEKTLNIPTPTRGGYVFQGWLVTAAEGNWEPNGICLPGEIPIKMYGNATLTAQWALSDIPVYFDTILDFDDWNTKTASNATISNVTANGFTLTSNAGVGEGTSTSPEFPVTPGKQYYIDIEVTDSRSTPHWDVYIFFYGENQHSGTGINFNDGTNRFSANGQGVASRTFTAPNGAVNAVIRLDANEGSHSVTFSDIRVYEAGTRAANVNVPDSSKTFQYGDTFGTLPVPTKEGFTFKGWFDENGNQVTAETTVSYTSAVYLKSKWVINNNALVSDTVVVDFASPIAITPLANDAIFNSAIGTKTFLGISSDGTNYSTSKINGTYGEFTVSDTTITYNPTKVVNGTEKIYYHASVTADGVITKIRNEITVAPASNILYEENKFEVSSTAGTGLEWEPIGTTVTANQDPSTENDVYGFDSSYKTIANYSSGSAFAVTVDETDKRSQNLAFTFNGTGFDLNSVCGYNTGVMIVSVRDNTTNKMVKSYIVDTYYSDYDSEGNGRYGKTLYQVPIISETALSHSNYTIQVAASWLPSMSGALNTNSVSTQTLDNGMAANIAEYANSEELREALADIGMEYILDADEVSVVWFDENSVLNGGEGANTVEDGMLKTQAAVTSLLNVIDSVRVYNPIIDGDQYYIPSERGVAYYNVIDNLVKTNGSITGKDLFAYITGKDKESITVENYSAIGPKDEFYLAGTIDTTDVKGGTGALVFTIKDLKKNVSKVMISLRAASGTPTVEIGEASYTIASNTEMYYDITDYVGADGTVTIENVTPNTLLSIGSLKISGVAQASIINVFNLESALAMMNAPATPVELNAPKTESDVEEPEDTTDPTEPEDTTDPTDPEDTTDPTDPEDTTDPTDPEDTTDPDEPANPDDSTECWLVRLINWIIAMFKKILSAMNSILGF